MSWFGMAGTAPIDLSPAPCIFKCGDPLDESALAVEMNVGPDGSFASNAHHHQGAPVAAKRVSGWAHRRCYAEWYEKTYGVAFTMSADGT